MSARLDPRAGAGAGLADVGEILALHEAGFEQPVVRALLRPEDEAVSLPQAPELSPGPVAALTRHLGPALTFASPAWYGDPVPRMRALQKVLVEHSLKLAEDDRGECMAALAVVEHGVRLRLRLQQMRMTAAEMEIKPEVQSKQEITTPS